MCVEEDDYMSDKFIQDLEKSQNEKNKINSNIRKRQYTDSEKDPPKKPLNIMQKNREEGLMKSIPSTNKGFAMLAKMGYKPGQGIGKTESGISEPVPIEVKNDRKGFGKRRSKAEIIEEFQKKLAEKIDDSSVENFRNRLAGEKLRKLAEIDFYKSQKVCKRLDEEANISLAEEIWFWPEEKVNQGSDEESETEIKEIDPPEEEIPIECKLEILTEYLRCKYSYCIWCGMRYNNSEDLQDNCPGNSRTDH